MKPLASWTVIFICAVPGRERRAAVDACRPTDAPSGITVVGVLTPVLFNRALEPPAAAFAVFLSDCFFRAIRAIFLWPSTIHKHLSAFFTSASGLANDY